MKIWRNVLATCGRSFKEKLASPQPLKTLFVNCGNMALQPQVWRRPLGPKGVHIVDGFQGGFLPLQAVDVHGPKNSDSPMKIAHFCRQKFPLFRFNHLRVLSWVQPCISRRFNFVWDCEILPIFMAARRHQHSSWVMPPKGCPLEYRHANVTNIPQQMEQFIS
jgi:hypothetical protein